jgi:hypothetical protein
MDEDKSNSGSDESSSDTGEPKTAAGTTPVVEGDAKGSGSDGSDDSDGPLSGSDYYDSADSFIDDTELVEHVEQHMRSKATKTKHMGFYANSGDLERVSGQTAAAQDGPPAKKRKAAGDKGTGEKKRRKPSTMEVARSKVDCLRWLVLTVLRQQN